MARIKGGLNAKKRHNRVLKLAKGYYGARSKQYRIAKQSVMRALTSAYAGRKQRKRDFRKLWIARINAASRINGLSYSQFMHGLKLAGVDMNRKMLADLAVNDAEGFATLVELAKFFHLSYFERSLSCFDSLDDINRNAHILGNISLRQSLIHSGSLWRDLQCTHLLRFICLHSTSLKAICQHQK